MRKFRSKLFRARRPPPQHVAVMVTLVLALSAVATSRVMADPPRVEPAAKPSQPEGVLAGAWFFAERETTVSLSKRGAAWQGFVTASPRAPEVGKWIVRDAKFDADDGAYHGTLVKPDDGTAVGVELTLTDARTLRVVGRKFVFTKTFVWTRKT